MPWVEGIRADPDVDLNSSVRADPEDRAGTRRVPVILDDVVDCIDPVDHGDPSADLAEGAPTDSVQDRFIFAARGRFIGRSGSVDLILFFSRRS